MVPHSNKKYFSSTDDDTTPTPHSSFGFSTDDDCRRWCNDREEDECQIRDHMKDDDCEFDDKDDPMYLVERDTPLVDNTDPTILPVEVEEECTRTIIPLPEEMTLDLPSGYDYFVLQKLKVVTTTITRITNIEHLPNKQTKITSKKTKIVKRKTKSFLLRNKKRSTNSSCDKKMKMYAKYSL